MTYNGVLISRCVIFTRIIADEYVIKRITMNFTFTEYEAQIILNALVQQPYAQVVDVINKLQSQAEEQINKHEIKPLTN